MITGTQLKKKLDKKRRWFLVLILVLIIAGIGVYFVSRPEVIKVVEMPEGESLEYKVVSESPKAYWIVIETTYIPSRVELETTAYKAWQKNKEKEDIFLYLPEMKTSGPAYGVAKFISQGLKEFKTNPDSLKGTKWEQSS